MPAEYTTLGPQAASEVARELDDSQGDNSATVLFSKTPIQFRNRRESSTIQVSTRSPGKDHLRTDADGTMAASAVRRQSNVTIDPSNANSSAANTSAYLAPAIAP